MEKKIDDYKAVLELANPEDKEYLLNKFKEIFGDTKEGKMNTQLNQGGNTKNGNN
jgi:hypothetical protein